MKACSPVLNAPSATNGTTPYLFIYKALQNVKIKIGTLKALILTINDFVKTMYNICMFKALGIHYRIQMKLIVLFCI